MSAPEFPSTVTILVAHGSHNPAAQAAHEDLVDAVAGASGAPVSGAYLELVEPSIPTAIDIAVARGAVTVRLLPCFLHPGNHVLRDIPQMAADARNRHPGTTVELLEHLGADPALVEVLARRSIAPPD